MPIPDTLNGACGAEFDARYGQLLTDLAALAELLRRAGDDHWADWIDRDRVRVANGDGEGLRHFLSAFGGMGSLNNMFIRKLDGRDLQSDGHRSDGAVRQG